MAYRREKLKEDGVLKKVVRGEDRIHQRGMGGDCKERRGRTFEQKVEEECKEGREYKEK